MDYVPAEIGELNSVTPTFTARLDDCSSARPRSEIKLERTVGGTATMAARHRNHPRVFGNRAENCVAISSDHKHRTKAWQLRKEKRPPIPQSDHRPAIRDANVLAKHGGDKRVMDQVRYSVVGIGPMRHARTQPHLRKMRSRSIAKN
jgi:hypothetical protein